ncbi:5-hydroxyisourate hydrolase isoform X1 [Heptranchias perlo]|uniref:5-hydroxyisourate hydrolase isoform X1 n=1 Tax=Heptranchias perlo TaxID=212740 RepID=UPI003559FDA1
MESAVARLPYLGSDFWPVRWGEEKYKSHNLLFHNIYVNQREVDAGVRGGNTAAEFKSRRSDLSGIWLEHFRDSCLVAGGYLGTGKFGKNNFHGRVTNSDGRCPGLLTSQTFISGIYKMKFATDEYWQSLKMASFYPYIEIVFNISDASQKYHIALLLSPFSYSTYRGS